MRGYTRRFKVNEGLHIEGNGQSIDVMIIDIHVPGVNQKSVFFRVEGFDGLEKFMLDYENSDMNGIPGVRIGVAERSNKKKSGGRRGRSINISFLQERGYKVKYRDYYGSV